MTTDATDPMTVEDSPSGRAVVTAGSLGLTHPLVRVRAAEPLRYGSSNWDVAWVLLRTHGQTTVRRLDPYTRAWEDRPERFACRWFAC